ncbi:MAG: cytidylate kinase-like family protein [Longicatena sp.]|nr:cytidylate kinase-like family protein [Longicatena sp.]
MTKKTIITISRQFGSGGRDVGKKLADALGIKYYDRELIEMAAKESGFDKEMFEDTTANTSRLFRFINTFGYSLGAPLSVMNDITLSDQIFLIQSRVVEQAADSGPCVIVGRCADYVLDNRDDVLKVFIAGDMNDRKKRAIQYYEVDERDVEASIRKIDRNRKGYYDYYTDKKWGAAESYDVCLNTSVFGIDGCVAILKQLLEQE